VTFAFVLIIAGGSEGLRAATRTVQVRRSQRRHRRAQRGDSNYQFFFMGSAIVVAVVLWAMLYRTGSATLIRAAVSDPVAGPA
jgi:hypothetical protein